MRVKYSPPEYIIAVAKRIVKRTESDMLLRALLIKNNEESMIRIEEVSFDLLAARKA